MNLKRLEIANANSLNKSRVNAACIFVTAARLCDGACLLRVHRLHAADCDRARTQAAKFS